MLSAAITPLWEAISLFSLDSVYPLHGNKAYKLAPNIRAAREQGFNQILTIGGAWSNHLWSTAHLASSAGMGGVVYVRGEPGHGLTPTMSDVERCGFDIEFLPRGEYRRKEEDSFLESLKARHPKAYWIPEGGSNEAGVAEAALIAHHVLAACPQVQHVVMAVGTGGTFAGLVRGLRGRAMAHGVCVTKDDSTGAKVRDWLGEGIGRDAWRLHGDYHWGGYAKCPKDLITFMQELEAQCGQLLEPIYVAKALWATKALQEAGEIAGQTVVVHTGGLQGRRGFKQLAPP
jgi:1-aminocyclopropane-1-carboxylate deaminase